MSQNRNILARLALSIAILAAAGCAGDRAFRAGRNDELLSQWDRAVIHYNQAHQADPANLRYKMALERARRKAAADHLEKGKMYMNSGQPELAVVELEQTVLLDPENDYGALELKRAREAVARARAEKRMPSHIEKLEDETKYAEAVGPILQPASREPISLNFPQPRPVKEIYQALGQAAGINVIFDQALRNDPATIVLASVSFKDALETLMRQENHFYKVIDPHTILIAADTPANRKTYEDLVIKTFYLSNGDVTEVANAIRALLGTVHISINKAENAITMRDTADKIAIAQRVIEQNDKEKAEVVIDVELLQLNTSKLRDLGLILPQSISATYLNPTSGTGSGTTSSSSVTLDQLKHLAIDQYGFTVPNFALNFIKQNTDAQLLAKPELRISEGEKAQLVIGDKVPIPTTTFNTQYAQGTGAIVPITSFQYQDVGIKIEMEPRVHHNKEVTLKMTIEVSNLGAPVTYNGQTQPTIGTRSISSTIRLKDGETNFLAGLIRNDRSNSSDGPAFLSDLPLVGRLFTHHTINDADTELVMTITPHIIRLPDINREDLLPVFVGTESNISYEGSPRVESFNEGRGPFDQQRPVETPRRLPPAKPVGQPLAPTGGPSNPFAPVTPKRPGGAQPNALSPSDSPGATSAPAKGDPAAPSGAASPALAADTAPAGDPGTFVQFGFDPLVLTLSPGQVEPLTIASVGGENDGPATLTLHYDPSLVEVIKAEPLGGEGAPSVAPGTVRLSWSGGLPGPSARPFARLLLRGIKAGNSDLSFESSKLSTLSGGAAEANFAEALVVTR